jgi:hypothetical protein
MQLIGDGLELTVDVMLGKTLDECAKKYRGFCQRYKPKPKPACKSYWGSKLLAGHKISRSQGKHKYSPGQLTLKGAVPGIETPRGTGK